MRRYPRIALLLAILLALTAVSYASHGSSRPSSTTTSSKKKSSSSDKTVHVRGYYRKDGTYVAPHDRRPPGSAPPASSSSPASRGRSTSYRRDYVADGYTAHPSVQRDKHGRIKRSRSARSAFMREHPCPATRRTSGSCPGYVVDHVRALECGGADAPSNMQWQTVADAKAKDKIEGHCSF